MESINAKVKTGRPTTMEMPNAKCHRHDVDGAGGGGGGRAAVVGGHTRGKLFWREMMSTRLQNLHVAATLHVAVQLNDHQRPRSFDLSPASIITMRVAQIVNMNALLNN